MTLWGIGMGAQESIMKAAVAGMVPMDKRGSAYGIFNTGYGLAWFLGSALMGILYDQSISFLVAFSVVMQLASIPVFFLAKQELR
jgi:MFS family permease